EAHRLRAAATQPPLQRQLLLADLGSRLAALVVALDRQGVPAEHTAPLRDLAGVLHAVHPGALEELWRRALAVLDAVAGHAVPPPPPAPPRRRGAFWKR